MEKELLLKIRDLHLHFKVRAGAVRAVDGVNFELYKNEAIVILGESGCGKSSLTKAILRLLPKNVETYKGKVFLNGLETMELDDETFRKEIRWNKMSLVPQAAMTSLNPVLKVGNQVAEPLTINGVDKGEAMEKVIDMFKSVGVPEDFINRYAFELSGGMRQRVAIAMSLITVPDVVILDEPTSALDVLTQANIMNLLKRIKYEEDVSYILVTHDIATSSELADRVVVMYAGEIIEATSAGIFFKNPYHPYSKKLMASVPKLRGEEELEFIVGKPPSLIGIEKTAGCRFAPRCPNKMPICEKQSPPVYKIGDDKVKCWLYEEKEEVK
ncbi:MAG: ABC transporter ATP-binding protein [Clostridiales bacterium]|nr:ABC transporter ATP-binding protein [Clostridiales bacterium]